MSEGITGSRSFGERYRDATGEQPDRNFRLSEPSGTTIRSRDRDDEGPHYQHPRRFSSSELQRLEQMGIHNDGFSTVFFSDGVQGARQAYHFAQLIGGANGAPAILERTRDTGNDEFQAELTRMREEGAVTGALSVAATVAAGGADLAGRSGGPQVVYGGRSGRGGRPQGNPGSHGGGRSSGPGRHGGGGGAPRGPQGGGGGTATATMPETLRGAGAPRAPAANVITPTGGQLGNTAAPQASLAQQQTLSPFANAAAQFALGDQSQGRPSTQTQVETQNPSLIPDGFGPSVATGINEGRRAAPDTSGAALGAAARERLNSGGAGTGAGTREQTGESYSGGLGIELDPTFMERQRAEQEQWRARVAQQRAEADAAQQARLQAALARNEAANQLSAQMREENELLQAKRPERKDDFVVARRVVDALPELLGPGAFAKYEEIMSDPIWRSALEREAHREPFLDFVQSIIAGNIHPRVAITRLRNDDPDTVGGPPLTGLSRGREWDIPDVERLLRPNEQDAFRRYAEAFPDIADIIFQAGYDASAGQMRDAIRALLNGAYGQDVAAWLRSGGTAGGHIPPGGNTPYTGTGAEFQEPERQPETGQGAQQGSRIIVPGVSNDQRIHVLNPTDDAEGSDPSAPSIIRTDRDGVTGTGEPRIWTPNAPLGSIRTQEDLENMAEQNRRYREEHGRSVGNSLTALFNHNFGQPPDVICDIHSHEGVCDPRTRERQADRLGYNPGFGTYDPAFHGVRPPGLTDEQWVDMLVDRLITQAEEMGGGQTVFFPVAPRFDGESQGPARYYLERLNGNPSPQTILGVLQVNRAEGTVYTNQFIPGANGNPVVEPFSLSIRDFQDLIGREIPPNVDTIEFVTAAAGCELHFSGTEVDEGLADNFASIIRHENETRGTNYIAEHYVLGLSAGNPREDGSYQQIYRSLHKLNQAEEDFDLKPGTIQQIWGETNLSKEIVHSLGNQTPLVYNTPEEKANLTRWAQAMGETGMPVIIHCDSGTATETDRLNTTGSLAALRLPSNNANVEAFIEFANSVPDTTVIWAHGGGLGFTVQMPPDHLDQVRKVLERAPNVVIDMSWDAIHRYIAEDPAGWARLLADHPTRFMFGSDTIATTQNTAPNSRLDVVESLRRTGLLDELDRIDPDLKEALFRENFDIHVTPGIERANEFRTNPENAEWLANGAEGPPPLIWQRGPDGEYLDRMIRNPARGE